MMYLDLALRGGAVTVLLLLAALLWRAPIGWEGRLSVAALAIAESAFMITHAAIPLELHPTLLANLVLISSLTPAAVTWLIVTIFLDGARMRGPWLIASLATSAALYAHLVTPDAFILCLPMAVGLFGSLFVLSLWSTRDDLVECRCRARPGFAAAIAGLALLMTLGNHADGMSNHQVAFALFQSGGTLLVAIVFAAWLLRPDAEKWPGEVTEIVRVQANNPENVVDPALIARIDGAMNAGIWREEGLTIGGLARKLAVPEHRLRRAINQELGYRNFSSFINRARINAACEVLIDPNRMNTTILEIAYDVGFASVGPFNRAFRAEMGQSPTEYRRMPQSTVSAVSEKSSSIAPNLH